MRNMMKRNAAFAGFGKSADRSKQKKSISRMVNYQKNMERSLNRKKTNHHMIRRG